MLSLPPDWKDAIRRAMRGDFGPPGDSLRSDIMDELADHLFESLKREERAGRNEVESRERVLKRFGSPAQIAARLWFDGMKGSIMFQRWMMGVSAAALLLAVVAVGFTFWMMQENNRVLLAAVKRLDENSGAPQQMEWTKLHFKAIDASNEQSIQNVSFNLKGRLIAAPEDYMSGKTDPNGQITFGPLRVGSLQLTIVPNDSCTSVGYFLALPGQSGEIVIRCPPMKRENTRVRIRLPSHIHDPNKAVWIFMHGFHEIDGRTFTRKDDHSLMVTGDGRLLPVIEHPNLEKWTFGNESQELVIPAASYKMTLVCYERTIGWHPGKIDIIPLPETDNSTPENRRLDCALDSKEFTMTAQPGVINEWILPKSEELPEEWILSRVIESTGRNEASSQIRATNQSDLSKGSTQELKTTPISGEPARPSE